MDDACGVFIRRCYWIRGDYRQRVNPQNRCWFRFTSSTVRVPFLPRNKFCEKSRRGVTSHHLSPMDVGMKERVLLWYVSDRIRGTFIWAMWLLKSRVMYVKTLGMKSGRVERKICIILISYFVVNIIIRVISVGPADSACRLHAAHEQATQLVFHSSRIRLHGEHICVSTLLYLQG